jgi:hypothetical protein
MMSTYETHFKPVMRLFYAWEFVKTNQYPQLAGAIDIKTPL